MADKYYAWTPISAGTQEKPVSCAVGEDVSPTKLGVSKEEFDQLIAIGSVRAAKYPEMPEGVMDSPVNFRLQEMKAELSNMGTSLEELEAE